MQIMPNPLEIDSKQRTVLAKRACLLKKIDLVDLEYDIEKVIQFGIYLHLYLYAISDCSSMNSSYRHQTFVKFCWKIVNFGTFFCSFDLENYLEG